MKLLLLLLLLSAFSEANSVACNSDSNCSDMNHCQSGKCVHKDLFPMEMLEYIGSILMMLISIVSNAGGIGGSSIIISILLLLFNFNVHEAIPLVQVFVFSGVLTTIGMNLNKRHSSLDRPLIYYDMIMMVCCPILMGVSIGVIFNPFFPEWILLCLLSVIISYLLIKVIKKAKRTYKTENALKIAPKIDQNVDLLSYKGIDLLREKDEKTVDLLGTKDEKQFIIDFNSESLVSLTREEYKILNINKSGTSIEINSKKFLNFVKTDEKRLIPIIPIALCISAISLSILLGLLKGKQSNSSLIGLSYCSPENYYLIGGYLIFMSILTIISSTYLINKRNALVDNGYQYEEGEIEWTKKNCCYIAACSSLAGLITGLLGGGNIMSPFLLSLGIKSDVSTITASFIIFTSTGTASSQILISGTIPMSYSLWFYGISTIGSMFGSLCLRKYAIKKGRLSYLIICITIIFFLSLLTIAALGIMNIINTGFETFQTPC